MVAVRRIALLIRATLLGLTLAVSRAPGQRVAERPPIRLDSGRATVVFYPGDERLARTVLAEIVRGDSFPGIPRPTAHVTVAIAPDSRRFREFVGPAVPDWGAAVAFPESGRIVMQGSSASAEAGEPIETLRHELAHLALHEALGDLPPRWFDEGYASVAAHEWRRDDAIALNLGLALRGMPTLDELEQEFEGGSTSAQEAYALAYRAVMDLSEIGGPDGFRQLLASWKKTRSLELAVRQTFGITLSEFERRWRDRTRRTYGALALAEGVVVAGSVIGFLILPLYLARRRRDRRRLAALVAADAVAEATEERSGLDEMLGETPRDQPPSNGP